MANKLQQFRQWLLEKRSFRVSLFAKDPQQEPVPEEALFNMPESLSEELVAAANELTVYPREKEAIVEKLKDALGQWQALPHASANSIVLMCEPVSAVSRVLIESGELIKEDNSNNDEKEPLEVSILDWVERPAKVNSIKQQIQDKLNLALEEAKERDDNDDDKSQTLMIIPNLCWCFLRSADGLDGLDYLQELLPRNRDQFWIVGSGIVGWEYLKSTLKFDAYCGKTIRLPRLSGEDLQSWLHPLVERFSIYFPNAALHKRLQNPKDLLDLNIDLNKPSEMISELSQEVNASVASSLRTFKEDVLPGDTGNEDNNSPEQNYFNRLSDISDGVSEVALQLFIKSLRYRQVKTTISNPTTDGSEKEVILKAAADQTSKRYQRKEEIKEATDLQVQQTNDGAEESDSTEASEQEYRLVVDTPKLPPLPDLSQSDLYLLYSLMLHGDLTVTALAQSLGDPPNVVNNQVQALRNLEVLEQKDTVLKINPVHYPKMRRELARNNFIIEVL